MSGAGTDQARQKSTFRGAEPHRFKATAPRLVAGLDTAIYVCVLVFAAALPHSKAVTESAYSAALLLWTIKLIAAREKLPVQPLVWGLLALLVLSAVSSALSLEPALSWARMKSVALLVIAPLFACNLRTARQIRTVIWVFVISGVASVGPVIWSYGYGIGARLAVLPPATPLYQAGARPDDIVMSVNGVRTRTPQAFLEAVKRAGTANVPLKLALNREELWKIEVLVDRQALLASGVMNPGALGRGRPPRARGSLGYSVTYAEVMLQIALLAFGLLVTALTARQRMKWPLLACFVILCALLGLTLTRASLVSLLIAGLLVVWIFAPPVRWRTLSIIVAVAALLLFSFWVRRERRVSLLGRNDAGTQYRLLMWQDGIRLAREHPWLGVGMDTIKVRWRQLDIRAYRLYPIQSHFHSAPIQLAAERGLLTLAAWIGLIAAYLALLVRLLRHLPREGWFDRGVALGVLGATLAFLCSGMVHYNLGDSEVQMLFWALMGVAMALNERRTTHGTTAQSEPTEALTAGFPSEPAAGSLGCTP